MSEVRTTTHTYPQAEIDAMTSFYGGKRCVISLMLGSVEWSHMLDAALKPCNHDRLSQMLIRKLCQNRHPRGAAEVRENIVPLKSDHHTSVDEWPPRATLFLHEDILARTLAYEQDLYQWRIAELEAGRDDPGRPTYEEVFGGTEHTQHRLHAAHNFEFVVRNESDGVRPIYEHQDCPGIGNPTSQNEFPIIDTLLSIPFSLLHTLPRLAAIVPLSVYQQQLVTMGTEVVRLWWWDPPLDLINKSEKIRQENAPNHDSARSVKPYPIHHQSRYRTTFSTKQTIITYRTPTTRSSDHNCNQDERTFELPSGQNLLGTIPSLSWDGDGPLLTPRHEEAPETGDVQHADKGSVTSLPMTCEAWDVQTIEGTETSDDIDAMEDIEEKPLTGPSSSDILSWYEQVTESTPEPLPLTPGSFERGVIASMSTNDVLMIKGLIDPLVYIQFFDLSSFSRL